MMPVKLTAEILQQEGAVGFERLKSRQRQEREDYPPNLGLRVHRALSWLQRAERADDLDGRFIFLWIAFNAAYANDIDERYRLSEQRQFRLFLENLCALDKRQRIENLVWSEFPSSIRVLLDNPYVFQDFWDFHGGKLNEWQTSFDRAKRAAQAALGRCDTPVVLAIVFSRIYTLRNQLIHGGATWDSSINREQVRDCVNLLSKLVPLVVEIMMDNPDTLWGDPYYPVIKD